MNRKLLLLLIFAAILIVAANIIACGGTGCGYSNIKGLCETMEVINAAGTAAAAAAATNAAK